jgi:type IV pilus assembly protein PilF
MNMSIASRTVSSWRTWRLASGLLAALGIVACQSNKLPSSNEPSRLSRAAAVNLQLGAGYLQQGNLALAKQKLERALSEDPHNPQIHSTLGLLDERLGKDKEADQEYRTSLSLAPHDPALLNNYAVFLCSHNRATEGVRNFEEAATNPLYRSPWAAFTNAGVCSRQAHHDAEAQELFVRALRSNPSYAEAVYQASDLDFTQQKYAASRLRIDFYLMNNASTPDLLLLGWRIAQAQSDPTGADGYARRLARDFPDSEQSHALAGSLANQNPR